MDPSIDPTIDPTNDPTKDPTVDPTKDPTTDPTDKPTPDPTNDPSMDPTSDPTKDPTTDPTDKPTSNPTTPAPVNPDPLNCPDFTEGPYNDAIVEITITLPYEGDLTVNAGDSTFTITELICEDSSGNVVGSSSTGALTLTDQDADTYTCFLSAAPGTTGTYRIITTCASDSPTSNPTTSNPTPSPIPDPCVLPETGYALDLMILVDKSCSTTPTTDAECELSQEKVAETMAALRGEGFMDSDNMPNVRVGYIEFGSTSAELVIGLTAADNMNVDGTNAATKRRNIYNEIRNSDICDDVPGQISGGTRADLPDLDGALTLAINELNTNGGTMRDYKILIFSDCALSQSEQESICDTHEDSIRIGFNAKRGDNADAGEGINVAMVNSFNDDNYILCLTEYDSDRIIENDPTDTVDEYETNIIPLVQDNICNMPTSAPTSDPTIDPTSDPTTAMPTTAMPTTSEPTTAQPTTAEPSVGPTADPTTTLQPTASPTTDQPTTDSPTTDEPTTTLIPTASPTTSEPTTDSPTTDEPTTTLIPTASPTTSEPTTDSPTTDSPTTNSPTTTTFAEGTISKRPTKAPVTPQPTTLEPTMNPTTYPTFGVCNSNDTLNIGFLLDESGSISQEEWDQVIAFVQRIIEFDISPQSYVAMWEFASIAAFTNFLDWTGPKETTEQTMIDSLEPPNNRYNPSGLTFTWDATSRVLDAYWDYRFSCTDGCDTRADILFILTDGAPSDTVCPDIIPRINITDIDIAVIGIGNNSFLNQVSCLDYRDGGNDVWFIPDFGTAEFNSLEARVRAKTCNGNSTAIPSTRPENGTQWRYNGTIGLGPLPTRGDNNGGGVNDPFAVDDEIDDNSVIENTATGQTIPTMAYVIGGAALAGLILIIGSTYIYIRYKRQQARKKELKDLFGDQVELETVVSPSCESPPNSPDIDGKVTGDRI